MARKNSKQLPPGISLRSDGRYQARYTLNGKRHTIYSRDLKEIQKKLRDAKYEMDHGIFAKPDKITVDTWFDTWMKEYQGNVIRETTEALYWSMYKHHIKDSIGHMKLQAVRPEHIQAMLNQMKNDGYAPSFIRRFRNVVNKMFKQAYLNDLIMRNPVEKTTTPKEEQKDQDGSHRGLTEKEQADFLQYADEEEPQYADIYYLGFSTGLRIGELFALEWDDVDFAKEELRVNGTMIKIDGKEHQKGPTKTDKSKRIIPLLPAVVKRLRKHKLQQAEYKLMMGEKWKPVEGLENLVFTTPVGRPLSRGVIYNSIDRIIAKINHDERMAAQRENREPVVFEHFSSHTMRHTFATRALENGIPPRVVQEYLGHKKIDTTLNIYTHVLPELKKEEIKKISGLF
jgi:integrase